MWKVRWNFAKKCDSCSGWLSRFTISAMAPLSTFFLETDCPNGQKPPSVFSVTVINDEHTVVAALAGGVFSSPYDPNGKWADIDLLTEASRRPSSIIRSVLRI